MAEGFYPNAGFKAITDHPQEKVFLPWILKKNSASLPIHIQILQHEKLNFEKFLAAAIDVDSDDLTDTSSPDNTPEWDSFAHMTMVAAMEEEFKITLTLDEVKSMQTLPIIKEVISQKL